MSDVRSLLRNERAARRVNHPQAVYTSGGQLTCKACGVAIKADALWQAHLTSSMHVNTLRKLAAGLKAQQPSQGTKRKAAEEDEDGQQEGLTFRKRARGANEPDKRRVHFEEPQQAPSPPAENAATGDGPANTEEPDTDAGAQPEAKKQKVAQTQTQTQPQPQQTPVDEDEWAAFERDVATPPPEERHVGDAIRAGATISAAPMTAAEIAAKSRQEESTQAKERRHAEIEGEKEDAMRRLEEEFDQMEELEDRVKRLKEQREVLRQRMLQSRSAPDADDPKAESEEKEGDHAPSEDEESDFDDGWDNWGRP